MGDKKEEQSIRVFFMIVALTGLALGLSDSVFSNYFKDAYQADALLRGIIEFPRELPGLLCMFVISGLAFLGDIRLGILAQVLSIVGLVVLGLTTPSFAVMLIFLFINSMGMHMFVPVSDSLGMSLAKDGKFGSTLGKLNGVRTALSMLAGILVFFGFRSGIFSFVTPIKLVFLLAAAVLFVVLLLLIYMQRLVGDEAKPPKFKIIFRKEYTTFYLLAILFGARKQIMFVYAPWVLIELLGFKADSMALLGIAGAAIGIFFIPAVGRWIDKFGTSRIMVVEAAVFFFIYISYGVISAGLDAGWLAAAGLPVIITLVINVLDRMTMQFGMVRSIYMRSIALTPEDVTPTLSVGLTLDHLLSIIGAVVCGYLWVQWGPQYVFILAALLSVCNMVVALRIGKENLPAA